MKFSRAVRLAALLVLFFVGGCGDGGPAQPDAPPQSGCEVGAKECRADGLYVCGADKTFELAETCAACEAEPVPHCAVSCSDAGVTSICEGASLKDCATGATRTCEPGTCMPSGKAAVCATKPGVATCQGRRADGTPYLLACADDHGVSAAKVCDRRTGECAAAAFDCSALTTAPDGGFSCDRTTGNYLSACNVGQPAALLCPANTSCASDTRTNCYTAPTAGAACGGPAVCYPGLHCTQLGATGASCVQPAGVLDCRGTDVNLVCLDADTGVGCVKGAVWWWRNLTTWGGSCASNHVTAPAGGMCIPRLADCQQGLECHRSRFDVSGICRTPLPNAPAECSLTGQISLGRSCIYDWHACRDGHYYDVDCRVVNIAGNLLTICDCSLDGVKGNTFSGSEICNVTTVAALDAKARMACGWDLLTTEVAE